MAHRQPLRHRLRCRSPQQTEHPLDVHRWFVPHPQLVDAVRACDAITVDEGRLQPRDDGGPIKRPQWARGGRRFRRTPHPGSNRSLLSARRHADTPARGVHDATAGDFRWHPGTPEPVWCKAGLWRRQSRARPPPPPGRRPACARSPTPRKRNCWTDVLAKRKTPAQGRGPGRQFTRLVAARSARGFT